MTKNTLDDLWKKIDVWKKEAGLAPVTETEMDEYIEKEHPVLLLSYVDKDEYKDVLNEGEKVEWQKMIQAATEALEDDMK